MLLKKNKNWILFRFSCKSEVSFLKSKIKGAKGILVIKDCIAINPEYVINSCYNKDDQYIDLKLKKEYNVSFFKYLTNQAVIINKKTVVVSRKVLNVVYLDDINSIHLVPLSYVVDKDISKLSKIIEHVVKER